jgi:hypothetical protein
LTIYLPFGIGLTTLISVGSYALFFVFILFGQRIQFYSLLGSVRRSLVRLDAIRDEARKETVDYFVKTGNAAVDAAERIDQFLNYVTIMPVDLDPNGIVQKIGHLADTGDERMRSEVKGMMKDADPVSVSVAQNLLEIAGGLNMIDKVVRHYYLTARKTNSYVTLAQLQMSLPEILEQASALVKAVDSIKLAQPIGDGVGPMVASKFLGDSQRQLVAKDTILGVTEYKGRSLYVLKAEGPMGYVGQPGVAMKRIIEDMGIPISSIIMVDAAAKLEGEKTGEVAEGMGAAIGGLGVEKFQIEEVSSKHNLPVYAVLVKEGDLDVMATMKKEITDGVEKAISVVGRIIEEKTHEGDKVLLAGIGNTLGVGQ